MQIRVKLFASFRIGRFQEESRLYPDGTRVETVVAELGLKKTEVGIILLNGRHGDLETVLRPGDTLALFPLLGGG